MRDLKSIAAMESLPAKPLKKMLNAGWPLEEAIKLVPRWKEKRIIAKSVAEKIRYQFPACPEGKLMFSVLAQAITDLFSASHRDSAIAYLTGPMRLVAMAGVDPNWVRSQLHKADLHAFSKEQRA